jgi:hypothetical protein
LAEGQLQASNRFIPPPFAIRRLSLVFLNALFVDAGLTQFVTIVARAPLIATGGAVLADNGF